MKTYTPEQIIGMRLKHPINDWGFTVTSYMGHDNYEGISFGDRYGDSIQRWSVGSDLGGWYGKEAGKWILLSKPEPPYHDDILETSLQSGNNRLGCPICGGWVHGRSTKEVRDSEAAE